MLILKRVNLFPIIFSFKRYGLTWQRLGYCCGQQYYDPRIWILLRYALFGELVWTCPVCHKRHKMKLVYNAVEVDNKEENKGLRKW